MDSIGELVLKRLLLVLNAQPNSFIKYGQYSLALILGFGAIQAAGRKKIKHDTPIGQIVDMLGYGQTRRDDNGQVISDLGYTLRLASDNSPNAIQLEILCGSNSAWIQNLCLIQVPCANCLSDSIINTAASLMLAEQIVNCWEPQSGIVTSAVLSEMIPADDNQIEIGWINFSDNFKLIESAVSSVAGLDFKATEFGAFVYVKKATLQIEACSLLVLKELFSYMN